MKIKLEEASPAQVRQYANEVLNLDVSPNAQKAAIISKMKDAGFDGDEIELPDVQDQAAAPETKAKPSGDGDDGEEIVTVYIAEAESGDQNVPVFVNGIGINIPRGKNWEIKRKYLKVLENAVTQKPIIDRDTGAVTGFRDVPRYNVRVVG